MKKLFSNLYLPVIVIGVILTATACCDEKYEIVDPPIHEDETEILTDALIGNWVFSTNENTWITYNFTNTGRIKVQEMVNGIFEDMSGGSNFYTVDQKTVTGSYIHSNGNVTYIDWKVNDIANMEIKYSVYDNNTYLGDAVINRVLTNIDIEGGEKQTPIYSSLSGSKNISNIHSLNEHVASVNEETGEITGISLGTTFIYFTTENGTAAIKVTVTSTPKSLHETIVGTWIYENLSDKEWQKTIFSDNGYVYVEWTLADGVYNFNEHADGCYTVKNENTVTFSVSTSYGMKINQEWQVTDMKDFELQYKAYSDGASVGTYNAQRLLTTITLEIGAEDSPDYPTLTDDMPVIHFSSHNPSIATVDDNGKIFAISSGRTYIDLKTEIGTAVIEINVEKPSGVNLWPDYTEALGLTISQLNEKYGNPWYESTTANYYWGEGDYIDFVAFSFSEAGFTYAASAFLKDNSDWEEALNFLKGKYYYYEKGSELENKWWAFTNESSLETSNIGITFDGTSGCITYVDLTASKSRTAMARKALNLPLNIQRNLKNHAFITK